MSEKKTKPKYSSVENGKRQMNVKKGPALGRLHVQDLFERQSGGAFCGISVCGQFGSETLRFGASFRTQVR